MSDVHRMEYAYPSKPVVKPAPLWGALCLAHFASMALRTNRSTHQRQLWLLRSSQGRRRRPNCRCQPQRQQIPLVICCRRHMR
eukprot:6201912-Pleurochrysis_carterae.AAC.2